MAVALIGLLLVAYVPGALIFRVPLADRPTRARLPAEERVFWGIILSVALTTGLVLVLAAFDAYTFRRLLACTGGLSVLIVLTWRSRLLFRGEAHQAGWSFLVPAVIVALGLFAFFPPSEYIMGGKDPGVYMNEGIQIAQRGSLIVPDRTLAAVPADLRDLVLTDVSRGGGPSLYDGVRFMGFFVTSSERGEVVGQFPHGFSSWIAVGYGLDGLTGARRAVGFWAILGVMAMYFAGSRLTGRVPAAAGAVLLSLNVAQVWFGRYPNSEVMQQALFFAAALALARAAVDGDAFFAPAAGVLLGLMIFTRFDAIILLAAVGGGLALLAADGKPLRAWFFMPLLGLLALAFPYYSGLMRAYISIPLLKAGGLVGIAATAGLLAMVIGGSRWFTKLAPGAWRRIRAGLPWVLMAGLGAAAVYAAFWREPFGTVYDSAGMVATQGVAVHDAYALRVYVWYVGALGLAAAVLGFAVVVRRSFWRDPVLLSVTAAVSLFVFYKIRIIPEHFWQARRYLPVILPMTCLLAASAVLAHFEAWRLARRDAPWPGVFAGGALRLVLPALVLGFLGWQYASQARPLFDHVEYAGLIPSLEKLAAEFTDRDLVLVESRDASDAHVLATPLAYIYAKNVLLLSSARPDRDRFERLLSWARGSYDRVVFLADGGTDLASPRLSATPLDLHRFQVTEYESSRDALPREIRQKKFSVGLYVLSLADAPVPVTDLDVGGFDDLWVLRLHAKEQGDGTTYRWTREVSYVSLQGLQPAARAITLRMYNGGRPSAAGPATVQILLNDRPLGTVTVDGPWRDYPVALPADAAATAASLALPSVLRLVSSTWTPKAVLGGGDDRALGVMLDRVRVE